MMSRRVYGPLHTAVGCPERRPLDILQAVLYFASTLRAHCVLQGYGQIHTAVRSPERGPLDVLQALGDGEGCGAGPHAALRLQAILHYSILLHFFMQAAYDLMVF